MPAMREAAMTSKSGYVHPEFLVDTAWVAEHMNDRNVRIVDCDVPEQYQRAHIPGSVNQPDHYQKDPANNKVHILGPEGFSKFMRDLGIGNDTLVIGYDNSRGLYAARLWWALNYYGHANVKVMNGGWRKWLSEGRPITDAPTKAQPADKFTAKANASLIATAEQMKASIGKKDSVIWDVRSQGEYTGETTRGNKRSGHISGAVHLEWLETVDNKTHLLKPADELRRLLESKGITRDKRITTH
ncbi:MAG: sulfurtransferase [SAR202 cluster bacterium]|nr:sulfurtransferase [SAR202 cluster bacterium]